VSRRRRLEQATKRESDLERELAKMKRQLARTRKRVEDLGGEVPEESPGGEQQTQQPEPEKVPEATCPKCHKAATKSKFGPREYWTCKDCSYVKPVGKKE
jgi:cytochrome c5